MTNPTDKQMLDWLEMQYVTVRIPLRYGSKECFMASAVDDDGEMLPSDLREKIAKAMKLKANGGSEQ